MLEEKTTWHNLYRRNNWIYATLNSSSLNAVCNGESLSFELQACGLVQLQPYCTLKNEFVTIRGHANYVTKLYVTSTRPVMSLGWSKQYPAQNISTKLFKPNIHELELVQRRLQQITDSSFPTEGPIWSKHSLIVGYAAITLIILAIGIGMHKIRRIKQQFFRPVAAPRTITNVEGTAC